MHDLNDALDELRSVIPYAHGPSVRKLSKIATLLLAKNYILMQARALDELRRLVGYMNHTVGVGVTGLPPRPSLSAATAVRPPSCTAGTTVIGAGSSLYSSPDLVTAGIVGEDGSEDAELQHVTKNYSPT